MLIVRDEGRILNWAELDEIAGRDSSNVVSLCRQAGSAIRNGPSW
jgi:hypothetical protein